MSVTGKLVLLAGMFFCHIADDYYLQGLLAQLKQREWWQKNAPAGLYRNDHVMALFEHAFSWSFVMSLPLLVVAVRTDNEAVMQVLLVGYVVNTAIHAYIDNRKANRRDINLVQDQCAHFVQVVALWAVALHLL